MDGYCSKWVYFRSETDHGITKTLITHSITWILRLSIPFIDQKHIHNLFLPIPPCIENMYNWVGDGTAKWDISLKD